ncbi:MAG: hypothetical protein M1818_001592 [Claussenomyces sp. TS43310]|nr:MAG: hypothetical protein M1818_001592 [Claussenomyces sp. TS43310]
MSSSFTYKFLRSQKFVTLPYPERKFTGQTIIVTGSNVGMGLEAARHLVRLDAEKVILAVRSLPKGEAAKKSIEGSEKRPGVVEVWGLDLASYASVKAFAARAETLPRLDVVIENAGIYVFDFETAEEDEATITVNVVSTFLLGLLLLPKLRRTAVTFGTVPVLSFVGSFVHNLTTFPERKADNVFVELSDEKKAGMADRYNVSKMLDLLCLRGLAKDLDTSPKEGRVIASLINPGFVDTAIMRNATGVYKYFALFMKKLITRTTEEGGRTLVAAAYGGPETHGAYLDDCKPGTVSAFVSSDDGAATQKKVWDELKEKLEKIQPGILQNI